IFLEFPGADHFQDLLQNGIAGVFLKLDQLVSHLRAGLGLTVIETHRGDGNLYGLGGRNGHEATSHAPHHSPAPAHPSPPTPPPPAPHHAAPHAPAPPLTAPPPAAPPAGPAPHSSGAGAAARSPATEALFQNLRRSHRFREIDRNGLVGLILDEDVATHRILGN